MWGVLQNDHSDFFNKLIMCGKALVAGKGVGRWGCLSALAEKTVKSHNNKIQRTDTLDPNSNNSIVKRHLGLTVKKSE